MNSTVLQIKSKGKRNVSFSESCWNGVYEEDSHPSSYLSRPIEMHFQKLNFSQAGHMTAL